jgi:hypothetical protein
MQSCACKAPNTNSTCRIWSDGGSARADIINAIISACQTFGPPESLNAGWKMDYCYAQLMASINKESSFNVTALAESGTTNPTVGLTQIRFSSTVCDFYKEGPLSALEAMGCPVADLRAEFDSHASEQCSSTYWSTTGSQAAHLAWMQIPACNIGLGAWYYYLYATGGGPRPNAATSPVYSYDYCHATGDAGPQPGTLATGLLSHLRGPNTTWAGATSMDFITGLQDSGITDYVSEIRDRMDCALGSISGTHPLFLTLQPNPAQYCN